MEQNLGFASERIGGRKRVAVITGANSGLGFETSRRLLMAGMQVVCACRSAEKGEAAVRQLLEETADRLDPAPDDALFMPLDVSSLDSVRSFSKAYQSSGLPLHVLHCNAGIMMGPHRVSVDGIELQLATNYLGHFELCRLLTDSLVKSAPARVVHVSSIAARFGQIVPQRLNHSAEAYDSRTVYSMTKLAQVVFSRALNRRLQGTGVTSYSLEPGVVATNLSTGITDNPTMRRHIENGVSVEEGAKTQVLLCGATQIAGAGGSHWVDCKDVTVEVNQWQFMAGVLSLSPTIDDALWEASERLVRAHSPSG